MVLIRLSNQFKLASYGKPSKNFQWQGWSTEEINAAYDRQEEKNTTKKARNIEDLIETQPKRLAKVWHNNLVNPFLA